MKKMELDKLVKIALCMCCYLTTMLCQNVLAADAGADTPASPIQRNTAKSTIATVNGKPIDADLLQVLRKSRYNTTNPYDEPSDAQVISKPSEELADDRIKLISDLVLTELMAQKAHESGIDKRPEVLAEAELLWKTLLQQLLVRDYIREIKIVEAELVERYNLLEPDKLYHVSHILVPAESAATAIIANLGKGKNFSSLARKQSRDKTHLPNGDMGWLMQNQMMSAFAEATLALKPGTYTKQPVNTPAGWHVIWLHAVKSMPKVTYAEVRGSLRQRLLVERVNERIEQLSKNADIKVLTK